MTSFQDLEVRSQLASDGVGLNYLRDPFPGNVIPAALLNSAAARMVQNFVPLPNTMGDMGMGLTMMGTPTVFGANQDSNNFLDVRDMHHHNNKGTARSDRLFNERNTLSVRYSVSKEDGLMPQNLPGFGFTHDNAAQNVSAIYTHVVSPLMVNTGSVAMSRLAMSHFSENSGKNDIVGQLGLRAWASAAAGDGRALLQCAIVFAIRRFLAGDSNAGVGHGGGRARHVELAEGAARAENSEGASGASSGRCGRWWRAADIILLPRGFTTETATNDGTGSAPASFLLGPSGVEAVAERLARHESAPMVWRRVRSGHVAHHSTHDDRCRAAL